MSNMGGLSYVLTALGKMYRISNDLGSHIDMFFLGSLFAMV